MRWSLGFFFYIVGYLYLFMYADPSLYLWDEGYLIMVDGLFNVFLDLVCKYLTDNLCSDVHQGNWSVILFFLLSLYVVYISR